MQDFNFLEIFQIPSSSCKILEILFVLLLHCLNIPWPWCISQLTYLHKFWTTSSLQSPLQTWFDLHIEYWSNVTFIAIFQFLPFSCKMQSEKVHSMKLKQFFLSSSKLNSIWVKISDLCAKVENQHIYNMSPNIL